MGFNPRYYALSMADVVKESAPNKQVLYIEVDEDGITTFLTEYPYAEYGAKEENDALPETPDAGG